MRDAEKTIGNLIDRAGVSIISSVDGQGYPNTKAMLPPRHREGIKHIYFTTNTSSMRVRQYTDDPKACVYFFDKRYYKGVMLKGTVEILHDIETKKMIWRDGDERYYALGISDPDHCVLKFTSQDGRYYSDFHSEDFTVI
jgi:general stress protein 26